MDAICRSIVSSHLGQRPGWTRRSSWVHSSRFPPLTSGGIPGESPPDGRRCGTDGAVCPFDASRLLCRFLGHHPDEIPRRLEDGKGKQPFPRRLHEFEQALGCDARVEEIPPLHDRGSLQGRLSRAGEDQQGPEGNVPGYSGHLGIGNHRDERARQRGEGPAPGLRHRVLQAGEPSRVSGHDREAPARSSVFSGPSGAS